VSETVIFLKQCTQGNVIVQMIQGRTDRWLQWTWIRYI